MDNRQVFFASRQEGGNLYFVTCLNGSGYYEIENKTILGSFHLLEFDDNYDIGFIQKVRPTTERIQYSSLLSYTPVQGRIINKILDAIKQEYNNANQTPCSSQG